MPGQAIVTIKGKQWSVTVANTLTELATGLSGVGSIQPQTGMLFDMGSDQSLIQIDMSEMLFPLDIIFINSTQGVRGVMSAVQPGERDVRFEATITPGARFFLEINAGEAEGIEVGDSVDIQGYSQSTQLAQIDLNSVFNMMIMMVFMVMMMKMMDKALAPSKERPKLPPVKPPPGYVPVGKSRSVKAPPQPTEEEKLQTKKLTLEDIGRGIAREAGVEFLRLDKGWKDMYATQRYWFKEPGGYEIVASDLEELKWKMSLIHHSEYHSSGEVKKVVFIGSCKVSEGFCLTHGYSVSQAVRCPQSPLADEEWKATWELVEIAFPEGQHNPWVNGWWPETLEEAEKTVENYAHKMRDAVLVFRLKQQKAAENYERAGDKAVYNYRQYVMREYERRPKEAGRAAWQ
jgi:uncharacterized membrane protein (UPF0127 family)